MPCLFPCQTAGSSVLLPDRAWLGLLGLFARRNLFLKLRPFGRDVDRGDRFSPCCGRRGLYNLRILRNPSRSHTESRLCESDPPAVIPRQSVDRFLDPALMLWRFPQLPRRSPTLTSRPRGRITPEYTPASIWFGLHFLMPSPGPAAGIETTLALICRIRNRAAACSAPWPPNSHLQLWPYGIACSWTFRRPVPPSIAGHRGGVADGEAAPAAPRAGSCLVLHGGVNSACLPRPLTFTWPSKCGSASSC